MSDYILYLNNFDFISYGSEDMVTQTESTENPYKPYIVINHESLVCISAADSMGLSHAKLRGGFRKKQMRPLVHRHRKLVSAR